MPKTSIFPPPLSADWSSWHPQQPLQNLISDFFWFFFFFGGGRFVGHCKESGITLTPTPTIAFACDSSRASDCWGSSRSSDGFFRWSSLTVNITGVKWSPFTVATLLVLSPGSCFFLQMWTSATIHFFPVFVPFVISPKTCVSLSRTSCSIWHLELRVIVVCQCCVDISTKNVRLWLAMQENERERGREREIEREQYICCRCLRLTRSILPQWKTNAIRQQCTTESYFCRMANPGDCITCVQRRKNKQKHIQLYLQWSTDFISAAVYVMSKKLVLSCSNWTKTAVYDLQWSTLTRKNPTSSPALFYSECSLIVRARTCAAHLVYLEC